MLTRSTQIGEFYVMMPPQIAPSGTDPREAGKHSCDLLIYDEESDKHVRISWSDALAACCIEELAYNVTIVGNNDNMKTGNVAAVPAATLPAFGTVGYNADNTRNWYYAAKQIEAYNNGVDFSGTDAPATAVNWSDLNTDIRIVLARPFIEHLMHSAVLCVAGRDTGATRTSRPLEPRTRHTLSLATHTRRRARAQSSARRTCSCRQTRR